MAVLIACVEPKNLDGVQPDLKISIPGIGPLKALKNKVEEAPSPMDFASQLLSLAQPALAPVIQIMRVIQVLLTFFECFNSIKNPFKLIKNLRKLAEIFSILSGFIPGLAHAKLVRDMLVLYASIFHGLSAIIQRWVAEIAVIADALSANDYLDDPELEIIISCSKTRLIQVQGGTSASLRDLGSALSLIVQILEIIKSFIPGSALDGVFEVVEKIVGFPTAIFNAGAELRTATEPEELNQVVRKLQEIASGLESAGNALDSISGTITQVVGA